MPEKPPELLSRPRPRIETLSDLIFGLSLSVGSVALVYRLPTSEGLLLQDVGTFAFTFLILITVWLDYTRIMSVMPITEQRTVTLNTILLFTVSLEPFLFIVLESPMDSPSFFLFVSQVYAIDLGVMMAVLAGFAGSLAIDPKVHLEPKVREAFRRESYTRFGTSGIFLVSAVPIFGSTLVPLGGGAVVPLRIVMWFVPIVAGMLTRRRRLTFGNAESV